MVALTALATAGVAAAANGGFTPQNPHSPNTHNTSTAYYVVLGFTAAIFLAIPGRTNHTWFKADRIGTYYGQCAELCGIFHEAMTARVIVSSSADYTAYTSKTAAADLGKAEFTGVCATCHGMQGSGGYGPVISGSSQITDPKALTPLLQKGNKNMPPVGDTWTAEQVKALTD